MNTKKQNNNKIKINGLFIYHNDQFKNIYYDILTKTAYAIDDDQIKYVYLNKSKIFVGIVVGFIAYRYFHSSIYMSIALGLAVCTLLYVNFRKKVLSKMTVIDNFVKPEKQGYVSRLISSMPKNKIIAMLAITIFITIICIYAIMTYNYTGLDLYLYIIMAGVSFVLAIIYGYALVKKQ